MTTPRALAAVLLASALALSACGSDKKDTASSAGDTATSTGDTASSAGDTAASGSTGYSAGGSSGGGVPAVTANATDLTKEPKAAAGTGAGPTTLQTKDLVVGKGKTATLSDTVTVHYVGQLYSDGSVFDSSWENGGQPIAFPLNGVVPGFAQGIAGMKIGGRREIVIPAALGYGPQAQAGIPANSVLVFIVDLKKIG